MPVSAHTRDRPRPARARGRAWALVLAVAMLALVPASASATVEEFVKVDVGGGATNGFTVALRPDGTVWTWGSDANGRLGNDVAIADSSVPVQVAGLTNVRHVAAGHDHALAVRGDGTVWAWGRDQSGQLGNDAALVQQPTPVQVTGLANVRQVAAGADFSLAVRGDGTVWGWGDNESGELGDGSGVFPQLAPVQVAGLSNVLQVESANAHSVALRADGTVWAWGADFDGQVGNDAAYATVFTPAQVTGIANATSVAAGTTHSLAVTAGGRVWAWGADTSGQLGNDAALVRQPTAVLLSTITNVISVSAGESHSLAVKSDGSVMSWGWDSSGQLGNDAALATQPTPVTVAGLADIRFVAAGGRTSTATAGTGQLSSWGDDTVGQLGNGAPLANAPTPASVPLATICALSDVDAQYWNSAAITCAGQVMTWGDDTDEQLGDAATNPERPTPASVPGLSGFKQVSVGNTHMLALRADGTVWAWGTDDWGQLGNDAAFNTPSSTPVQVPGLTGVREVAAGNQFSVALKDDGTVWAWGRDTNGQLGNDAAVLEQASPVQVSGLANVRHIATGIDAGYAIRGDGSGWAWGSDFNYQLGNDAAATAQYVPVAISGMTNTREIEGGMYHGIATKADGTVWTWGYDGSGQLGVGATFVDQPTPAQTTLTYATTVAAGYYHSVVAVAGGGTWSFGTDVNGQLGNGATTGNQGLPVMSTALSHVVSVAASEGHTMTLSSGAVILAWGGDQQGRLGDDAALVHKDSAVVVNITCAVDPNAPSNSAPLTGTTSSTPALSASAFNDPNGDTHQSSQWQVRTNAGTYASPFADSGVTAVDLTAWTVTPALTAGQTYWFHVRYRDSSGAWSPYSTETSFVYDPNAPLGATLVSPGNGASTNDATLVATYLDSAPASTGRVEIEVCTTSGCGTVLESGLSGYVASGANGSWTHSRSDGTYWWRARSVDAAGSTGPWTAAWSFTFVQPPNVPSLVSPTDTTWVATPTPTLVATYVDASSDPGVDLFQWCRTNAGATDWSNVANCATGYGTATSASGASGVDKSVDVPVTLGQGTWYWRAAARDAGGATSAYGAARQLRVDSLPPTSLVNVNVQRSGLGRITVTWTASTDAGIGAVTYDVETSANGSTWNAQCTDIATTSCNQTGLGGAQLSYVRVRACDALNNCTSWNGRLGSTAQGWFPRTTVTSTVLPDAANRRATSTSGTNDYLTYTRVDNGELGWQQFLPATNNTTNPVGTAPPATPTTPTGSGWIIEETAGKTIAAGGWTLWNQLRSTASDGFGWATCRVWIVTVTGGNITASSNFMSGIRSYSLSSTATATSCSSGTWVTPRMTLAANQYVYFEMYWETTNATTSNNQRVELGAEGANTYLQMPPLSVGAPTIPTILTPAASSLSDPTVDASISYGHGAGTSGAIEYEFATDTAFTSIASSGASAMVASGAPASITSEALTPGTYYLRARGTDTSGVSSDWSGYVTVTVSTAPNTPTHVTPADGATNGVTTQALQSSAFADTNTGQGDTHTASQWQVAIDGSAWTTGQDSGTTTTALTTWTPPVALVAGQAYWWHVRHRDAYGQWSAWSTPTRFTVALAGTISLSLDTTNVALGTQTPNVDTFGEFVASTTTTNATGLRLTATGTSTGTTGMACGACATPFTDYPGAAGAPNTWGTGSSGSNGYLGITVRQADGGRLAKWGTGNGWPITDVGNNLYAPITSSATILHQSTAPGTIGVRSVVRAAASATTSSTLHSEVVTVSVVANP